LSHCQLWTQDRRLAAVAQERGLAMPEVEGAPSAG
jgi:predicted nucleic acid-binding protein